MKRSILIILGLIILILIAGFIILKPEKLKEGEISFAEKQQIEAWIIENNLNQYGDAKDAVYMGGTPLFDEKTGQSIDKYEYILRNYPNKPWLK